MMIHRLFCCSDTHGRLPPIPVVDGLRIEAILHAGDVYNGAELFKGDDDPSSDWGDPDVAEAGRWIDARGPVHIVRGNHDLADPHRFFARSNDMTGRATRLADRLLLVGVGWHGERHYELPGESEIEPVVESVRRQLRRIASAKDRIILLTHYPPRAPDLFPVEISATGWWHDCTRRLVEELEPVVVVQGHIHELAGHSATLRTAAGSTLFVSPGKRGMVISVDVERRSARILEVV